MSLYGPGHSHYDHRTPPGEERMKFAAYLVSTLLTATCALSASAAPTASPSQSTPAPQKADTISRAVGLNELKIEMAETRLKLVKDPKIISDLASALEEYLNTTCMAKLPNPLLCGQSLRSNVHRSCPTPA